MDDMYVQMKLLLRTINAVFSKLLLYLNILSDPYAIFSGSAYEMSSLSLVTLVCAPFDLFLFSFSFLRNACLKLIPVARGRILLTFPGPMCCIYACFFGVWRIQKNGRTS